MSLRDVQESIERLRAGVGADAVELIDRRVYRSADGPPASVGDALRMLGCLRLNWEEWYRALETAGDKTETCDCGARHQLHGTVIEERWALVMLARGLLVSEGTFEPSKALAYVEWVLIIGAFLEDTGSRRRLGSRGDGGGGTGPAAELAIPLSWHRKSHT